MIRIARPAVAAAAAAVFSLVCQTAVPARPVFVAPLPWQRVQPPPWPTLQFIKHQPPEYMQLWFLMTDGTIVAQSGSSNNVWYRYTPDSTGGYMNGTWTQIASLQSGYNPSAFSSAVMIDGRLTITGGEYNSGENNYPLQLTNLGASYDPLKNKWTPLGHPTGWNWIGDSPNSVLANGYFFVGNKLTTQGAVLNPKTLKWAHVKTTGKSDFDAEEGFTLLPNGDVLTADVLKAPNSELWIPSKGKWVSAGSTIVDLHSPSPYGSCLPYGPGKNDCYLPPGEIGPSILRPDGTVFYTGSYTSTGGAGHTAIFDSTSGKWTVGPDFPNGDNAGDSFAALLPDGNVLVLGTSGTFYSWNGSALTAVGQGFGPLLPLPTGQLMCWSISGGVQLFTDGGSPQKSWAPVITSAPTTMLRGKTYKIEGMQFNGLSQAVSFGDEYQNATNYPLAIITNNHSGDVFYARTHDHSTMGVATGKATVYTYVDIPPKMETGASTFVINANGISSAPQSVTIN